MDVQLSLKMPDKALGIEHVRGEIGKAFRIGHGELAGQVQGAFTTTVVIDGKERLGMIQTNDQERAWN